MTRIFTLENANGIEQHKVKEVSDIEKRELVDAGKAVEVEFSDYDQFRQKAQQLHSDYKKAKAKIEASDNPMYTDEVKKYELDKAYQTFEKESQALQTEWTQKRQEMKAEAYRKAAKAKVPVSQEDRDTADQIANRLSLKIKSAPNAASLAEAVKEVETTIGYLSDAEKTALQANIDGVLQAIEDKASKYDTKQINSRGVLSSVQNVSNLDLLAGKLAEQIPDYVADEYRTISLVKKSKKSHLRH